MGTVNSTPVVSQVKSAVQAITGDLDGARETQLQFVHQCPVASQITSVVYLAKGDKEKCIETNKQCVKSLSNLADGIPVVGHVKGAIHYIAGDKDGGDNAMKSACRTTGVIIGGVGGFCAAGPPGAILGGISGGAIMDEVTTLADSVIHDEYRPSGILATVDRLVDEPSAGAVFDLVTVPVFDGVTGYGAGQVTAKIQNSIVKAKAASAGNTLSTKSQLAGEHQTATVTGSGTSAKANLSVSKSATSATKRTAPVKSIRASAPGDVGASLTEMAKAAKKSTQPSSPKILNTSEISASSPTTATPEVATANPLSAGEKVVIAEAIIVGTPAILREVRGIIRECKSDGKNSEGKK